MIDSRTIVPRFQRIRTIVFALLLPLVVLIIPGCASDPTCSGGLHPYNGKCLSNMAIQYVGCTEGRGISPTTEIGGDVGGTFKSVADASLKIAYKKTEQENTPVALQIVKDCMEVARSTSPPDDPDQATAADYQKQFDQQLQQWQNGVVDQTPSIKLSRDSAKRGQAITVSGAKFWPGETVDISVHATLAGQAKAGKDGSFSVSITVPRNAPPPDFDTTIMAAGESSAKSARAPFRTVA
ncbi:hypothetical protein ACWEVP_28770 [Amycolatopsis sp. NPDC003865]